MVKVIWRKAASPPQTDGSIVFARWRQCALNGALLWGHIGTTWWIRLNLCFLLPTQVHKPNGKSTTSAIFTQLTVISTAMPGHAFSPNNCPFAWGIWAPSNTIFLGPTRVHNPNGISICSAVFAQITADCRYALQGPFPPLNYPLPWGSGPHLTRKLHGMYYTKWFQNKNWITVGTRNTIT